MFMLFVFPCINRGSTRLDYMSNMASVLQEAGAAYPSRAHVFTLGFWCHSCCSSI